MKALSIQQPWATLVCCGLKDVENRKWALKNLPITVLIHAGAKRQPITDMSQYEYLPMPWIWAIDNYKTMGIIPERYKDFPTSAVVGVATIKSCDQGNESLWAQRGPGAEFQWVMKDVKLFKEPITGVKGALGIFDIPEIDENNLPEFVEIPKIERVGTTLRIPVRADILQEIKTGYQETFELYVTEANLTQLAEYDPELGLLDPLPTEKVIFFNGTDEVAKDLKEYYVDYTLNDRGLEMEFDDELGRLYNEVVAYFEF